MANIQFSSYVHDKPRNFLKHPVTERDLKGEGQSFEDHADRLTAGLIGQQFGLQGTIFKHAAKIESQREWMAPFQSVYKMGYKPEARMIHNAIIRYHEWRSEKAQALIDQLQGQRDRVADARQTAQDCAKAGLHVTMAIAPPVAAYAMGMGSMGIGHAMSFNSGAETADTTKLGPALNDTRKAAYVYSGLGDDTTQET